MITLTLPWPSSKLSPNNSKTRWHKLAAIQDAKALAWARTRMSEYSNGALQGQRLHLTVTFFPPNRRHFDLDNLAGRCKAYQDGIFLALGLDDQRIDEARYIRGQICKPDGQVVMVIEEAK